MHTIPNPHLDRLNRLAEQVARGRDAGFGVLSTGEALYVALAANRADLLGRETIAGALDRIGPDWTAALVRRWSSVPHPSLWAPDDDDAADVSRPPRP